MKDIFASIYELFISVYGDNLAGYLYGFCDDGDGGLYSKIGLLMVIITILFCAFYYLIYTNSRRYKLKFWLGFLVSASLISGFLAFYLPYIDFDRSLVCPQYLFSFDNVVFFGIVNIIYSAILFFLVSVFFFRFIGKKTARYTPF